MKDTESQGFTNVGFYLFACWCYEYPFSVRTWEFPDYDAMFRLLKGMGFDRVMTWPMTEVAPPPLSAADAKYFTDFRQVIEAARERGLECWLAFTPNLSSTEDIRSTPLKERIFYPHMKKYRLDDSAQFDAYTTHLHRLLACVNNADGYVFIDGDPGGYPQAQPMQFLHLLSSVRGILDEIAVDRRPKIVPWVWCGWGADWEGEGAWKPDLRKLVRPFLQALKDHPPAEPWELLPGRSFCENHGNRRINFELTEEMDLIDRSTLLTYEIIEFEPSAPAFIIQFDDIRRVIRQEIHFAPAARGIMGNAQQPVTALQNLFYFAQCAKDPAWLDKSDEEVLAALANFLGGDAQLLIPAWRAGQTTLDEIPPDLPKRLRHSSLFSELAQCIPGGSRRYLDILAEFIDARETVLRSTAEPPQSRAEAFKQLSSAAGALIKWWLLHRYIYSGEGGSDFDWRYVHPVLLTPLREWARETNFASDPGLMRDLADEIAEKAGMELDVAKEVVSHLLE